jgi:hypothetical protein
MLIDARVSSNHSGEVLNTVIENKRVTFHSCSHRFCAFTARPAGVWQGGRAHNGYT